MANKKENVNDTTDREIITRRLLNAPRELVFEAFTRPEHLANWWGPNGFTITTHEMEVKPGSAWRFMMHGPDGVDYPNKIVYQEIVRSERLVYAHTDDDAGLHYFHVVVTFEAIGSQTELTMHAVFNTPEDLQRVIKEHGALEGAKQTINRLEEEIIKIYNSPERVISTSRVFDAPRELVYKAWTDPEHLAKWWGPAGFTNTIHQFDLKVGGHWKLTMHGPDKGNYENESVFFLIEENKELIWDRLSQPLFRVRVLFEDEGSKTRVSFSMHFATADACEKVRKVALLGNEQNLDRLRDELIKMQADKQLTV